MPILETPNTVTVGTICISCALFSIGECPYENHLRSGPLDFKGDIRGKCVFYQPFEDIDEMTAGNKQMTKTADKMTDTELNIGIYRKIMAMEPKDRKRVFDYWNYLLPEDFASDLVTDKNETRQRNIGRQVPETKGKKGKGKKRKGVTVPKNKNKFPEASKTEPFKRCLPYV